MDARVRHIVKGLRRTAVGSHPFTINASNGTTPDATQSFTLTVTAAPVAPTITSVNATSVVNGSPYIQAFQGVANQAFTEFEKNYKKEAPKGGQSDKNADKPASKALSGKD